MKTLWLTISFIVALSEVSFSQSNKAYCVQEITWFGIDYSQAYFIDDKAFPDPDKLKDVYFLAWNNFVFKEANKYDISRFFNKKEVFFSTSYINSRNKEIDIFNRIGNFWVNQGYLNPDSIQSIISSYHMAENIQGVGLVFIVEKLDKPNRRAIYWVAFFDIETKKVLLTEPIIGRPAGAGTRNYWANSFYSALVKAERTMGFVF
ncbi:MAG: hypothetical protein QM503_08150 [Bacteroidota bacterium]